MTNYEPLRAKLEAKIAELMHLPIERCSLVFDMERSFLENTGHLILYWRRMNSSVWWMLKFEITRAMLDEAMPPPDEPPGEFIEAHLRWKMRDEPHERSRDFLAASIVYRVSP